MINCSQVIVSCLDEATNNFLFTLGRLCAVFKTWRDEKMNDDKDKKNAIAMTENDAEDEEDEDTDELGDDPDQDSEQHSDTEQQEAHPPAEQFRKSLSWSSQYQSSFNCSCC